MSFRTALVVFSLLPCACVGDDVLGPPGAVLATEPTDAGASRDAAPEAEAVDASRPGPSRFDPRSLTNLRLWLSSGKGVVKESVGHAVVTWTDVRGHVAVRGGTGAPPVVVPSAAAGLPAIAFAPTGGRLEIAAHPDFDLKSDDFVVAYVVRVMSGNGALWDRTGSASPRTGFVLQPGRACWRMGGPNGDGCTNPTVWLSPETHVVVGRRVGGEVDFRVDGATLGVGVVDADLGSPTRALYIGIGPEMIVSEIVVLVGATADPDLGQLERYLKTRYLIP